MKQIEWFEKESIQIHAQIVVCPSVNDDDVLESSIFDLSKFYKKDKQTILSIAVVPVGLTKFRPKDDGLIAVDKIYAKKNNQ